MLVALETSLYLKLTTQTLLLDLETFQQSQIQVGFVTSIISSKTVPTIKEKIKLTSTRLWDNFIGMVYILFYSFYKIDILLDKWIEMHVRNRWIYVKDDI